MTPIGRHPRVVELARDLGLAIRGDCLVRIRDYALRRVAALIDEVRVDDLDDLRRLVANRYSVKIEVLRTDEDVARVSAEYRDFHRDVARRLAEEFTHGDTEGITLEREVFAAGDCRYLAVVDGRGERGPRAYFTAWHEVTHLVIHPEQLQFPGFRRTTQEEIRKDPIESVVDHVAGRLAFYAPLYGPVIRSEIAEDGCLNFRAVEAARSVAAPTSSLLAAAIGSVPHVEVPTVLVAVGMALKPTERQAMRSPQRSFAFAARRARPALRVTMAVANDSASRVGVRIRQHLRVPESSAIAQAFASSVDVDLVAEEDQDWWETSATGALKALPVCVEAIRRGRYVYGLVTVRD